MMGCMAERAGDQLVDTQIAVLRDPIESYLREPYLRAKIVIDDPGADLDAAAAVEPLEEARRLLAPFFVQQYAVGDLVDVIEFDDGDTTDKRHTVSSHTVRKRPTKV